MPGPGDRHERTVMEQMEQRERQGPEGGRARESPGRSHVVGPESHGRTPGLLGSAHTAKEGGVVGAGLRWVSDMVRCVPPDGLGMAAMEARTTRTPVQLSKQDRMMDLEQGQDRRGRKR